MERNAKMLALPCFNDFEKSMLPYSASKITWHFLILRKNYRERTKCSLLNKIFMLCLVHVKIICMGQSLCSCKRMFFNTDKYDANILAVLFDCCICTATWPFLFCTRAGLENLFGCGAALFIFQYSRHQQLNL